MGKKTARGPKADSEGYLHLPDSTEGEAHTQEIGQGLYARRALEVVGADH